MKDLLDKLIADAPEENEGAASLQLQVCGQMFAGAVRHSPDYKGLYELLTVAQQSGGGTIMVSMYFQAKDVTTIFVPKGKASEVIQPPKSGIILPGTH